MAQQNGQAEVAAPQVPIEGPPGLELPRGAEADAAVSAAAAGSATPSSTAPAPAAAAAAATPTPAAMVDAAGNLNAEAPAFVPGKPAAPGVDDDDIMSKLPAHHRSKLRGFYQAYNGEFVTYYVGRLKTYNSRTGYGFVECKQSKVDWGGDVFIHKNQIPVPWNVGQPVEFAVQCNNRGQPQACDCNWLPRLPTPQAQRGPVTLRADSVTGGYNGPSPTAAKPQPQPVAQESPKAPEEQKELNEPRRLGTLKSFSQTQGYGFVACDEVNQAYKRDVYLDRTQMPQNSTDWRISQLIEFSVSFNARGHPQARRVNWEPVPLTQAPADPASWKRNFAHKTLDQLKRLLRLLHEKQVETAVVTAIDLQGGSSQVADKVEDQDSDVDYVFFVLDRLGNKEEVLKSIKDFVKMLFVLMLSKMLRTQGVRERTMQLISWYEAVAKTIETSADAVRQHYQDVLAQINSHLKHASQENPDLQDQAVSQPLQAAFQMLKDKAKSEQSPASAADAGRSEG
eukprot:TRINITY_DN22863_c0_g4_i1.p1 TRINITY_DN22863_c0_g4~~TRINITY_DN22863_c0_g4_i1.p1  ORF type:complete len:510 (+),score=118.23 TRINITY_DN22863_c0_g4_i1:72-1601(+)